MLLRRKYFPKFNTDDIFPNPGYLSKSWRCRNTKIPNNAWIPGHITYLMVSTDNIMSCYKLREIVIAKTVPKKKKNTNGEVHGTSLIRVPFMSKQRRSHSQRLVKIHSHFNIFFIYSGVYSIVISSANLYNTSTYQPIYFKYCFM